MKERELMRLLEVNKKLRSGFKRNETGSFKNQEIETDTFLD